MSVELFEEITDDQLGTRRGSVIRSNLNLITLPPSAVSENEATIRGAVTKLFLPAFFDDSLDVYFAYKEADSTNSPTEQYVTTYSENQTNTTFSLDLSGLTRNTAYQYTVFGEIDGRRIVSGNPDRIFQTGLFSIATSGAINVGQTQATLVGELAAFRSLVFENTGPFRIQSAQNSGVVTYENTKDSDSPLFVLEAFSNDQIITNINTADEELDFEATQDVSFSVSEGVTLTVQNDEETHELDPEEFDFESDITRDINAGFEYKKTTESSYRSVTAVNPPEEQGDTFQSTVSLEPNTDYEFRAWGTIGSFERVYGNVQTFTTLEKEIVELDTLDSESVVVTESTVNGEVTRIEPSGRSISVGFNYGSSSVTDNQTALSSTNSLLTYSNTLTGLDAATTYEYQAFASGDEGTYTGPIKTFTTEGVIMKTVDQPSSADEPSKQPTEGTAFLFGEVLDLNPDSSSADVEFQYGKEEPLGLTADPGPQSPSDDRFEIDVQNLDAGEEYKYKVVGTDPTTGDVDEGSIKTFNTVNLEVATNNPTSIGQTQATVEGEVTTLELSGSYDVYFEYRKKGEGSFTNTTAQSFSSATTFTETISSLAEAQVYEYRAVIEKNTATEYGETKEFQTNAVEISTLAPSNVLAGSSDLNGELTFFSTEISEADVFFDYREQGDIATSREFAGTLSSATTFSTTISGLTPNTTYEYRAGAKPDTAREQLGTFQSFTTEDLKVTTDQYPISRTTSSITLGGELTVYTGSSTSITVGHQYIRFGSGNIKNGTKVEADSSPVSSLTTFQTTIPNLVNGTKYLVRAYAEVGGTTTFGQLQEASTNLN